MLRALQILGLNAVPAVGYFGGVWSPATMLLLYWSEGLIVAALIAVRIVIHRRATRKRGHYLKLKGRTPPRRQGTLLQSFLRVAIPFNLVHGLFLFTILFLLLPNIAGEEAVGVDLGDLRTGLIGISVLICAGFLLDLFGIERRPFSWIEKLVERSMGRVVVIHMSILLGMAAMAFHEAPRTFFMVFITLKTLSDLSWMLPYAEVSSEPPRWLAWIGRIGKDGVGESFADFWRRTHETDERQRQENEEALD